MLIVISPAKTLDYDSPIKVRDHSQPDFLDDAEALIGELRALSPPEVSTLMGISDKLGALNAGRYQDWTRPFTEANARQAILAFKGDVYTGLAADRLDARDLKWAQKHLAILSGLYGLLKPLDLMQPYRLEMGTPFANRRGKNLYEFWGERITLALNQRLARDKPGQRVLINLASQEYFKAVIPQKLDAEIITPVFKDWKGGQYKIISFHAKKARGMMAGHIIRQRLTDPEAIKGFDGGGYRYNPAMSSPREWVFLRDGGDE
ncbi:MAG: peroxide stress protein YaaA [Porticoccaceae bacterium]|jgi:cytoplasmic iron level regulating protein YaaA (DUF328/UPF0246 family)|nr:peroxide stress protein YaaA [Porticoccaceae bacterium]HLS99275.1 peroxide stress protein YaaA [Porticoccaceae bacterium]